MSLHARFTRRTLLCGSAAAWMAAAKPTDADYIGVVSWSFREYFRVPQRGRPSEVPVPEDRKFDMLEFPRIVRDRFGLTMLDLVNTHLSSTEPAYLDKLNRAVSSSGTRVWNVKVDLRANISDPDPAARRAGIDENQRWIDIAARIGSPLVRINSGHFVNGKGRVEDTIDSYKRLADYGATRKVKIIVENHGGVTASPDALVRIVEAVKQNIATGPDTRNFTDEVLHGGLRRIFPYAATCDVKTMDIGPAGQHDAYDVRQCIAIALETGYKGPWMIEFVGRRQDPFEGVARSRDLLTEYLKNSRSTSR